jgi:hypothetical protein
MHETSLYDSISYIGTLRVKKTMCDDIGVHVFMTSS